MIRQITLFFILSFCLLITPAIAFEDTVQNHPSDDPEQGTTDNMWFKFVNYQGSLTIIPYTETYNKALRLESGANSGYTAQYAYMENYYPSTSNYWSWVVKDYTTMTAAWGGSVHGYYHFYIFFYDSDHNLILQTADLKQYFFDDHSNVFYELVVSSDIAYLYSDGNLITSIGSVPDDTAYLTIYLTSGQVGDPNQDHILWSDSWSTDGYVIGIGTDESPETWINVNSNDEIDVEWTINTIDAYGTWNDTEIYQIRVTWLDSGSVVNTTTLPTTHPNGNLVYDRLTLMPVPNYGIYKFDLLKDSVVMESDYLTFVPIGSSGTLSWDKVDYVPSQNASITYAVTPYTPADYNYYIRTYDINTGLVDTNTIPANSGTITESLDAWETGSYYSLLVVVDKSDGTEYTVAYDVFDINDEVRFEGYTYDADNGTILNETNVNFSQTISWYNTTSNATAFYELEGLSDNIEITLNASKTNFTHEDFTFTPLTAKIYSTNLYLFHSNRSLNGTSIVEGMTVDYPLHQALGNATVNLYNATWSNNTTSNAFGYYQFNLSELINGTYTVNATLAGYDNSSEYSITVVKNESTVQNIVLNQAKLLTVTAIDSETASPILNFTASVDGMTTTVGDGDAEFYLDWGLYTVTVTSSGYYSNSENVLMDQDRNIELILTKIDSEYYVPHYVKFTVWGLGGYYEDVDVSVYKYGETDTEFTGVTGTDGAVTFKLSETQRYTITFISSSQGINKEMVLYPVEDSYLVFIASTSSWDEYSTPLSDAIDITVTTAVINSTAAYVNVTYTDTLQQTTTATVYLNQTNNSDPYNQTVVGSQDGFSNNWTHSFIVSPYVGESYFIHVVATHTTYETIDKTYAAGFNDNIIFDGIPDKFFLYLSIFIMLFTAGMFGAQSVQMGSMILCAEGWIFLAFGWFNSIDSGLIMTGLGFATVFSLIANINAKQKKEGL